jgi:hypothetical protein
MRCRGSHLTVPLGWPMLAMLITVEPRSARLFWHDAPLISMATHRRLGIYT